MPQVAADPIRMKEKGMRYFAVNPVFYARRASDCVAERWRSVVLRPTCSRWLPRRSRWWSAATRGWRWCRDRVARGPCSSGGSGCDARTCSRVWAAIEWRSASTCAVDRAGADQRPVCRRGCVRRGLRDPRSASRPPACSAWSAAAWSRHLHCRAGDSAWLAIGWIERGGNRRIAAYDM